LETLGRVYETDGWKNRKSLAHSEIMKKIIFSLYFFLVSSLFLFAETSSQEQLQEGIHAYQNNAFEKALNIFEALNQTRKSAGLFGYIGNCHIKMNHPGQGIAAYLSALKRDPNNPDLRHNLQHALSQTEDQLSLTKDSQGLTDLFLNTVRLLSVWIHRLIFIVLFCILFLVCVWYGIYKNALILGHFWILSLSLALIFQGSILFLCASDMQQRQGVVNVPVVKVRYGPSQTDTEAFLLHLGSPFEIYHREGSWAHIRLKDGKAGWLPAETFIEVQ
jgi:hypothetical protein